MMMKKKKKMRVILMKNASTKTMKMKTKMIKKTVRRLIMKRTISRVRKSTRES
jgi:hypothetical protein